jgi:tetratricopeptide (TPR) repeat protein
MSENLNEQNNDNLEKFNKAIGALKNSLNMNPKNHNLYIKLGNEYLKLNRFELAFKSYLSAYNLEPNDPEVSLCIGNTHKKSGNLNDAASAFLNAIKIDKKCKKAYKNLSNIYFHLGRHKEGLEYLYKVEGFIQFQIDNGVSVSKGNI